jgi:hypothetical protein
MRTSVIAGIAITACLASTAALAVPASGASAKASASTGWKPISAGNKYLGSSEAPSVAQFGSGYEAVWLHTYGTTNHTYGLDARLLNAAGKPLGKVIAVTSGWAGIGTDPVILKANDMRVIAFNGYKGSNPSAPYGKPAEYYFTSTNGKSWTLDSGSLSAAGAYTVDAAVAPMGSTSIITAEYGGDRIDYNVGFSAQNPRSSFDGHTDLTGNYADLPGVAATSTNAWIAWFSDSSTPSKEAIQVQQVLPSAGTRVQAPLSYYSKTNSASATHERVPIVVSHGKPYLAYARYDNQAVEVWRFGAKHPVQIHSPATLITMASGPSGRLWLMWANGNGWYATRSNKADTRFGPTTHISLKSVQSTGPVLGAGSRGPLVATGFIGNYTNQNKNAVFATQIRPRLTCSVSPGTVKPGKTVSVGVRDAGDKVKGAKVTLEKASAKTKKSGTAKLHAPHVKGTYTAKVGLAGYVGCSASVHVA